jgi:hypothetical protein
MLETAADILEQARALALRHRRTVRDALIVIGLARAAYYYIVQAIHPWDVLGTDARAYWQIDLAHPYLHSGVGDLATYLYSPAFAQVMAPFSLLPWPVYLGAWTVLLVGVLAWLVKPWPWALLILFLPISYELFVGNIHLLIAAALVDRAPPAGRPGPADPDQDHARHRGPVVPGQARLAQPGHLGRGDPGHRGRLVRPPAGCLVRLDRLPAGVVLAGRRAHPAGRARPAPGRVRGSHQPGLAGPDRRLDRPARRLDQCLGDPAGLDQAVSRRRSEARAGHRRPIRTGPLTQGHSYWSKEP